MDGRGTQLRRSLWRLQQQGRPMAGPLRLTPPYGEPVLLAHVHLLIMPDLPGVTAERVVRSLKRPFFAKVLARWRELSAPVMSRITDAHGNPHFWQKGGGYDRNITSNDELFEKIDYSHANPIRAGLVQLATDGVWSSAQRYGNMTTDGPTLNALPG